jgi:hypothetical protein
VVLGQQARKDVMVSGKLTVGFDMGVNSSENKVTWVKSEGDQMRMAYPSDQSWGAVFITVGKPKQPPRPFRDFSAYNTLTVEMKGGVGKEQLEVGLKTNAQPDDGSETKLPVTLTTDWKAYRFSLERFEGADLDKLYVVTEFVFSGGEPATVFVRNIAFSSAPK